MIVFQVFVQWLLFKDDYEICDFQVQTVWLDQKVLDVALNFRKLILGLIFDVGTDVRLEVYVGLEHGGHFF